MRTPSSGRSDCPSESLRLAAAVVDSLFPFPCPRHAAPQSAILSPPLAPGSRCREGPAETSCARLPMLCWGSVWGLSRQASRILPRYQIFIGKQWRTVNDDDGQYVYAVALP